jgi:MFS family permease
MHRFMAGACMPEEINYTSSEGTVTGEVRPIKRISWPAIFAGTMVALGTEILFVLFGLAIAFIIRSPGGVQAWSVAWYLITSIIALYVGGWVAARLSSNPDRRGAQLHGLVTWGLTMLTTFFFLASSAWDVLSTSANVLATAVGATPQGQAAAAQMPPPSTFADTIARSGWMLAFVLFGGVLLAAISSWVGGAAGKPTTATRV